MELLVLGTLALVVDILEGRTKVIGTKQQILLGNLNRMGGIQRSKEALGEGFETFRGALGVRVTELREIDWK